MIIFIQSLVVGKLICEPFPNFRIAVIVPTLSELLNAPESSSCYSKTSQGITHRAVSDFNTIGTYTLDGVITPLSIVVAKLKDLIIDPGSNGTMDALSTTLTRFSAWQNPLDYKFDTPHCQNLTVFRIHNNHTSLGGAVAASPLFQR